MEKEEDCKPAANTIIGPGIDQLIVYSGQSARQIDQEHGVASQLRPSKRITSLLEETVVELTTCLEQPSTHNNQAQDDPKQAIIHRKSTNLTNHQPKSLPINSPSKNV